MGGGSRSSQGRSAVLALVVLLLAGLAVVIATAGPAQFGEPRFKAITELDAPFDRPTGPSAPSGAAETPEDPDVGLPGWTTVLWGMGVCMALVLVLRWVLRLLRGDAVAREVAEDEPLPPPEGDLRLLALMRRGVRDAAKVLDRGVPGEAERDAVIRCWLALESTAARAGVSRSEAQTPTEFVGTLLQAQHADAAATSQLLSLYHQARFGRAELPADAIDTAHDALERIATTLGGRVDGGARANESGAVYRSAEADSEVRGV
jgi:Domain of unknown function (DUF4129)